MSTQFQHVCLTIAGSDSGGGAGIQADLKTFAALHCFGTSAITAVTAQNTCAVTDVNVLPPAMIEAQIKAVIDDFPVKAIKIGMLADAVTVDVVARAIRDTSCPIVLDPVMVASTGARLLDDSAVASLKQQLIPLATVLTPNIDEACLLLDDRDINDAKQALLAAQDLLQLGCQAVLIKGGHLHGDTVIDQLIEAKASHTFENPRLPVSGHGTGCTLASAIAAGLAGGLSLTQASRQATEYVAGALAHGKRAGKGSPTVLDHFWR